MGGWLLVSIRASDVVADVCVSFKSLANNDRFGWNGFVDLPCATGEYHKHTKRPYAIYSFVVVGPSFLFGLHQQHHHHHKTLVHLIDHSTIKSIYYIYTRGAATGRLILERGTP